jgi:hypothetical protein
MKKFFKTILRTILMLIVFLLLFGVFHDMFLGMMYKNGSKEMMFVFAFISSLSITLIIRFIFKSFIWDRKTNKE